MTLEDYLSEKLKYAEEGMKRNYSWCENNTQYAYYDGYEDALLQLQEWREANAKATVEAAGKELVIQTEPVM
jgi:hypothetical protein